MAPSLLPDTIRCADPDGLRLLRDLARLRGKMETADRIQSERIAKRTALTREASAAGVSWADMSKTLGISDASIIQAIKRADYAGS